MAESISNEIRKKIVIHKENKMRQPDIAKWLIISESTVTKVWSLFAELAHGSLYQRTVGEKHW